MGYTITFTGDLSLNGHYGQMAEMKQDPFIEVSSIFANADLNVVNLEAVCESPLLEKHSKGTKLSIRSESLEFLSTIRTGLVTLANNHVYDNLQSGFETTIKHLKDADIKYVGASPINEQNNDFVVDTGSKTLAILNYVHEDTHPGVDANDAIKLNIYDRDKILSEIRKQKVLHDIVILVLHWGQDNSRYPAPWQRKDAKSFVNAGADIIIGHHSHVLQGFEKFGDSLVFYSLGNFSFSPMREGEMIDQNRQIESVVLELIVEENSIHHKLHPVELNDHISIPINQSGVSKLSRRMKFISTPLIWPFYLLYLNVFYKIHFYFFGNDRNLLTQLKRINPRRIKRFFHIY